VQDTYSNDSVHDGWGIAPEKGIDGDAIEAADTKNMDYITKNYAASALLASGTAVGLSEGLMGNSEVGYVHLDSDVLHSFYCSGT